jgi:hypothetical protein
LSTKAAIVVDQPDAFSALSSASGGSQAGGTSANYEYIELPQAIHSALTRIPGSQGVWQLRQ